MRRRRTIGPAALGANNAAFNTPFVTITLCAPGSSTNCQTIDHVILYYSAGGIVLAAATGGWHAVFIVAAAMNAVAALMAWFVLRPMRLARYEKAEAEVAAVAVAAD